MPIKGDKLILAARVSVDSTLKMLTTVVEKKCWVWNEKLRRKTSNVWTFHNISWQSSLLLIWSLSLIANYFYPLLVAVEPHDLKMTGLNKYLHSPIQIPCSCVWFKPHKPHSAVLPASVASVHSFTAKQPQMNSIQ